MAYLLDIPKKIDKMFLKLSKKDKIQFNIISRKINEILQDPYRYKPLTGNMAGIRRVHIGKSFVLTYEILEKQNLIRLLDYEHHERIYEK